MIILDDMEYASDAAAQAAWAEEVVSSFSQAYTGGGNIDQTYNIRMVLPASAISVSGSSIRLFLASYKNPGTVSGCSIGERSGSSEDFASAPTRVTFDGGSNGCTIPDSGGKYSDWINFSIDETKDYLVHLYYTYSAENRGVTLVTLSGTRRYYKAGSAPGDETMTQDVSGYTGDSNFNSVGAVQIKTGVAKSYAESTIKKEGDYSLKIVALQTASLNKTVTRSVSPTFNLSGQTDFKFDVRSNRTGSNFKIGLHDSGGTTTEVTPNIASADTWQEVTLDLSAVSDANKDAIDSIIYTQRNADAETTVYMDYMRTLSEDEGTGTGGSPRFGGRSGGK